MVAVLGLYEPFKHERTIVVWCVSGYGVAILSPLWGKYGNYYSVPCHQVLVQTRIGDLISTQHLLLGCELVLNIEHLFFVVNSRYICMLVQ